MGTGDEICQPGLLFTGAVKNIMPTPYPLYTTRQPADEALRAPDAHVN
jgi:hypothetical protein